MEQEHTTKETTAPAPRKSIFANPLVQSLTGIILIVLALSAVLLWRAGQGKIKIDKSVISAPSISISPTTAGTLLEVYVRPGDTVSANAPLAKVGTETLTAQIAGIVTAVQNTPGATITSGQSVVTMINPSELRVVGTIDENKGLDKLAVGQSATFTVDAFGSKKFTGIVERIAPRANESAVVFSISDKRETRTFDVTVRFDTGAHPEFKDGMSARLVIYTR
jgi:multidrug resistance efflux pump